MQIDGLKNAPIGTQVLIQKPENMIEANPVPATRCTFTARSKQHHSYYVTACSLCSTALQKFLNQTRGITSSAAAKSGKRGCQHPRVTGRRVYLGPALLDLGDNHVGMLSRRAEHRIYLNHHWAGDPRRCGRLPTARSLTRKTHRQHVDIRYGLRKTILRRLNQWVVGGGEVPVYLKVGSNQRGSSIHYRLLMPTTLLAIGLFRCRGISRIASQQAGSGSNH